MSLDWEDPRRVLRRHGLAPKRGFSQNFLVSRPAVERIAAAAVPDGATDRVVELGPGVGTLTTALLQRGAQVIAVERDPAMVKVLQAELATADGLTVVHGDATKVDLKALLEDTGPAVITGNLPYAVTGAILRNLIEQSASVSRAVVMVQREVRDRLLAQPRTKDYGALTIFVANVFAARSVLELRPTAFHPPPKVRSSVVELLTRPQPAALGVDGFPEIVRAAFQARRKTLKNALQGVLGSRAAATLQLAGIDGERRGETLTVEEFVRVAQAASESR